MYVQLKWLYLIILTFSFNQAQLIALVLGTRSCSSTFEKKYEITKLHDVRPLHIIHLLCALLKSKRKASISFRNGLRNLKWPHLLLFDVVSLLSECGFKFKITAENVHLRIGKRANRVSFGAPNTNSAFPSVKNNVCPLTESMKHFERSFSFFC